jgi:hypothetical protein
VQTAAAEVPVAVVEKSIWTRHCQIALARANNVFFDFEPLTEESKSWDPQKVRVTFVKSEVKEKGKPYQPAERTEFEFEGFIRRGFKDAVHTSTDSYGTSHHFDHTEENFYKPASGMWSISVYRHDANTETTALTLLPVGAKVRFEVGLDYMGNGYAAKHCIHGDALLAVFTKGKLKGNLLVDTTLVEHNTARFGVTAR